jgi:hypothetical protein
VLRPLFDETFLNAAAQVKAGGAGLNRRGVTGGQRWWDTLSPTFAIPISSSPVSLPSLGIPKPARADWRMSQCGKPILPVLVADGVNINLLPGPLTTVKR